MAWRRQKWQQRGGGGVTRSGDDEQRRQIETGRISTVGFAGRRRSAAAVEGELDPRCWLHNGNGDGKRLCR